MIDNISLIEVYQEIANELLAKAAELPSGDKQEAYENVAARIHVEIKWAREEAEELNGSSEEITDAYDYYEGQGSY